MYTVNISKLNKKKMALICQDKSLIFNVEGTREMSNFLEDLSSIRAMSVN